MKIFIHIAILLLISLIEPVDANIIFVSSDGNDESGTGSIEEPFLTIQKGIDESNTADTVMVLNGIYTGGLNITNKQISLIGESMSDTKMNVPITNPNISIIDTMNTGDTIRIENFKIKRGNSPLGGGLYINGSIVAAKNLDLSNNNSSTDGGAINLREASLKLQNAQIYLNGSETYGGAINCNKSYLEITNSDVYNNSSWAGGAIFVDSASTCFVNNVNFNNNGANRGGAIATFINGKLEVHNSTFYLNSANGFEENVDSNFPTYAGGGGIYQEFADTLIVTNTTFNTNQASNGPGGAMALYHGSEIILNNLTIRGNIAGGGGGGLCLLRPNNVSFHDGVIMDNRTNANSGGGIFFGTESLGDTIDMSGTFNRLLVVNNWAYYGGGGMMTWNATLDLFNSTFAMNEANDNNGESSWQGGGLAIHSNTYANIVNTIFHDNYPNSIHDGTMGSPFDIGHSRTEEEWNGYGNITDDPMFVNPSEYDFSLQTGSPCIDAGTSDMNYDGTQDYFDFIGESPDMGAIEWMIGAPESLTGFVNEQDSSVILSWNPIANDDLEYYRLQRSSDSLFSNIDAEYFVTNNPSYTDENITWNSHYYYRVSGYLGYWTEQSNTYSIFLESLNSDEDKMVANYYKVYQNFPNPFNPITTLSYEMPNDGFVKIVIYDMMGRVVKNLLNRHQSAGIKSLKWDAKNNFGEDVSAGTYFYVVDMGNFKQVRKMLFLK